MIYRLIAFRNLLRRIIWILLPPFLVLIAVSLLAAQFTEISSTNEVLSLSSFIVLLSFSALAFNWCRIPAMLASERILKQVYQAGVDLFLASLLALIATFFAWLQTSAAFIPKALGPIVFILHWLFLAFSLLLFLIAILELLQAVKAGDKADH